MRTVEKTQDIITDVCQVLKNNPFFGPLSDSQRDTIINRSGVVEEYADGECILKEGDDADFLFVVVSGEVIVVVGEGEDSMEIRRLKRSEMAGEIAVLLNDKRSASCIAQGECLILKLGIDVFKKTLASYPEAGLSMMRTLAERLKAAAQPPAPQAFRATAPIPPVETLRLLPIAFMQRHRVAPVKRKENKVYLGCCNRMDDDLMALITQHLPGMTLVPVPMETGYFEKIMQNYAGETRAEAPEKKVTENWQIQDLLSRLVEEGGSDLHLSACQIPRWRIDGTIRMIHGFSEPGENDVFDLLKPIMRPDSIETFMQTGDEDFAYTMDAHSRFRVNILRDHRGVSAVLRHIPNTIFTLEELGMPDVLKRWVDMPKGLVLITGPTGSGKSTTLAAMIDHINRTRECHILTIEDPVEFVHQSKCALVNQREVGVHTESFSRALRAGLREDPDVVMVGEMRDAETTSMALETANTGHLVLATLHTSTAMGTLNRIVDQFSADAQEHVRSVLADNLLGVCCQTLCKKTGRGRVPALEILVMDYAAANMIRERKTHMLASAMATGKNRGCRLLNDELIQLVQSGQITREEAISNAFDQREITKKLGFDLQT